MHTIAIIAAKMLVTESAASNCCTGIEFPKAIVLPNPHAV
jgi:hypothetical protein